MSEHAHKLAVGTAQFGMDYGIANRNGQVHGDEILVILDMAWENGLDTLDTAKAYGNSEESIGKYIKLRPANKWIIITKISDVDKKVEDQIKNSTEKLTISPSVILAHSVEHFLEPKFQNELAEARKTQTIIKVGVSLYSEYETNQVLESGFKPDIIQLPLNILDTRLYHRGILRQLAEEGIEIHTRSVFLQGLFYLPESELNNRFYDVLPYLKRLKSIAKEAQLTLSELSLLWNTSLEEVSKVVIGVDNAAQLETHLESLEKKVNSAVFEEALVVKYGNEQILNPSLWD